MTIRDARPEDAEAIAGLLGQLGYPTDPSAIAPRLERLSIVGDRVVVAELDGTVTGMAHFQATPSLTYDRPTAKVGGLVVDEAHRASGIGRALLAELEQEARARGCVLVSLTAASRRAAAHEFYRHVGLEETGKRFDKRLD
jgi:GNAT superfamily N-acetyltransferase